MLSLAAAVWCAAPSRGEEPLRPTAPAPKPEAAVSAAMPAARLAIEKDVVDLGEIARGTKAEGSFVLRNTGTTPVKILSAKPG
jgi:hypothetical protein